MIVFLSLFIFFTHVPSSYAIKNNPVKDHVVLQLRWNHQFQFAGYYAAQWMGYYSEEGLDVEIRSASTVDNKILYATEEVAEGRADFGIGGVDILIAQNDGADFSVISSIFQRSAVEYYLEADTPFRSIVDLTTLKTARRPHDLLDIELQAMLINEGISPDVIRLIEDRDAENFSVHDLTSGKFDVIPGYLGTIPYYAEKEGITLKTIKPIDYGIDFYGDCLFTTNSLATENPELVERFRRASLKGWKYALEHPEEIAQRIARELPAGKKPLKDQIEYNLYQAQKVLEFTLYPVVEIGNMNPHRWEKMQDMLLRLGLVDKSLNIDQFIFDYEKMVSERSKWIQNVLMTFLAIVFSALLVFFMVHLTSKNTMLESEIDQRKNAEDKINRSRQRYQAMFNSAVLGITITTREGIIIQANEMWSKMIGYTREEMIGKKITELFAPDDKNEDVDLKQQLIREEIDSYEIERKYLRKDGGVFWGRLFMTSIYDQDSEKKVNMAMVIDITNAKIEEEAVERSEERFRRIIKEVASEIDIHDPLLLHSQETQPTGIVIDEKSKLSLKLEKINLELEKMFKKELDENRKKEALIIYQARLAAMGEMIANIAHQWRQPLNNLGLVLSNIEDAYTYNDLDSEFLHHSIDKSRKLISKMSDTIDDFRYFLNPKNEKKHFSIYTSILSVLDLLEENLRFHHIDISFDSISDVHVDGYENQFSQAIFNIITNSIDALACSSSHIRKIIISIYEEDGLAVTEIKDNAGGVSEDIIHKVFDIYFTTKKESKGTGLGLYITKTIIENNMDGKVELKNLADGVIMKVLIPTGGGDNHAAS